MWRGWLILLAVLLCRGVAAADETQQLAAERITFHTWPAGMKVSWRLPGKPGTGRTLGISGVPVYVDPKGFGKAREVELVFERPGYHAHIRKVKPSELVGVTRYPPNEELIFVKAISLPTEIWNRWTAAGAAGYLLLGLVVLGASGAGVVWIRSRLAVAGASRYESNLQRLMGGRERSDGFIGAALGDKIVVVGAVRKGFYKALPIAVVQELHESARPTGFILVERPLDRQNRVRPDFEQWMALQHPRLVPFNGYLEHTAVGACLLWDWTDAPLLMDTLSERPDWKMVLKQMLQIVEGLKYIEESGLDVSCFAPQDVLIESDGNLRLLSYRPFRTPEAEPHITQKVLGQMFTDLLVGRTGDPATRLRELRNELPESVLKLLAALLSPVPEHRPPTMKAVLSDLQRLG